MKSFLWLWLGFLAGITFYDACLGLEWNPSTAPRLVARAIMAAFIVFGLVYDRFGKAGAK